MKASCFKNCFHKESIFKLDSKKEKSRWSKGVAMSKIRTNITVLPRMKAGVVRFFSSMHFILLSSHNFNIIYSTLYKVHILLFIPLPTSRQPVHDDFLPFVVSNIICLDKKVKAVIHMQLKVTSLK